MVDVTPDQGYALLTVDQMYRADAAAIAAGTPGEALMEAAGAAIARVIVGKWSPRPTLILCGPGNNGGDGFVVARLLQEAGWSVTLALLGDRAGLKGDAAIMAGKWTGPTEPLPAAIPEDCGLLVDALFGAGLSKDLDPSLCALIEDLNRRSLPCVAVDVPSGVDGNTGSILGAAPQAEVTVTFFRRKPGHLLLPGRALAGETVVADIGILDTVLDEIAPMIWVNDPALWVDRLPVPLITSHKYSRGHAVIAGGSLMTGAARLAARGAARIGAGMVTIAAHPDVRSVYASDLPGFLVSDIDDAEEFARFLDDPRRNAVLVGPGAGVSEDTRNRALAALARRKSVVLDADAISAFETDPAALFSAISTEKVLLTPHEGEFVRVFAHEGDKLSRARAASAASGAVVLIKGADTVIAAPDGRAVINNNAPPTLATAGSGDVLAGFAVGLMAQGMSAFDAACAAAWLHGAAATAFGPGLIASDLPDTLPEVLRSLNPRNL